MGNDINILDECVASSELTHLIIYSCSFVSTGHYPTVLGAVQGKPGRFFFVSKLSSSRERVSLTGQNKQGDIPLY